MHAYATTSVFPGAIHSSSQNINVYLCLLRDRFYFLLLFLLLIANLVSIITIFHHIVIVIHIILHIIVFLIVLSTNKDEIITS